MNNNNARRPLAIGQKHIIVTCNYEARSYGVKKLQSRQDAIQACPSLLILEGSDLLQYKRHSRAVYEAFRLAVQEIANQLEVSIPARKCTMDEMMADLSNAVNQIILQTGGAAPLLEEIAPEQSFYIFGETASEVKMVEDQTGLTTTVMFGGNHRTTNSPTTSSRGLSLPRSRRNVHEDHGTEQDRQLCTQRLNITSKLVGRICQYIKKETGFSTTGGISSNPLLAKLASDLNKPNSRNMLYPWDSSHLLYPLPLRKLQSVGSRTMRALEAVMEPYCLNNAPSHSKGEQKVKTVL